MIAIVDKALRDKAITSFLNEAGWKDAQAAPLAGDASNRRYLRIAEANAKAVLMDAPPETGEDTAPFIAVTEWLLSQGLSAPNLFASDGEKGFLLIEDLGDALFARYLESEPDDEELLYTAAVELLVELSRCPLPAAMGTNAISLHPYDMSVLEREAALLTEWWLPAASGKDATSRIDAEYRELLRELFAPVAGARDVVVLRDYHAENLLWLPDRSSHAKVGLLDYQDALAGHAAYDLVSLLEDARRDTTLKLQEAMLNHYLDQRPDLERTLFRRDYALLGAQRNLKIVGIFARLWLRDGKPQYLDLIPRVWNHLMHDLSHPDLTALREWIDVHVPAPDAVTLDRVRAGAGS